MIDPNITDETFGSDFLGGKSQKTARKRILEARIPYMVDCGRWMIRLSDAEAWRLANLKTPEAPSLKSMLREISERVLRERQQKTPPP